MVGSLDLEDSVIIIITGRDKDTNGLNKGFYQKCNDMFSE